MDPCVLRDDRLRPNRYRSGFYATPKVQDSSELRRKQLVDALASPVQYTGLRPNACFVQPSSAATPSTSSTAQKRPAEFNREKGNAIDLEVITLAFDSNHKVVGTNTQAVVTELTPEEVQKILQTGIGIPEKLDLAPGAYEVKFAVRDNPSGLLGTVSVPFELK